MTSFWQGQCLYTTGPLGPSGTGLHSDLQLRDSSPCTCINNYLAKKKKRGQCFFLTEEGREVSVYICDVMHNFNREYCTIVVLFQT